jgi:hypothetical protein
MTDDKLNTKSNQDDVKDKRDRSDSQRQQEFESTVNK